ncbi:Benzoate 1,2-dioxygenase beta subunit [Pseudonocardia sp. Ae406_Ps2]|uniref:aromatic-ring-hydroxylating dioxygenase subunit beta n=1 Tax=unclassified Pseudonocardia TaxID=2619320 RepID=UPI00094B761B|nr:MULTISPECIES: aromatic-ring-hydroxylating dioxygenase subunit beta [unclassified Pseudonocardia]OLL96876.1 Benzoate 1,2-dioxygenase beta subunit [Pseudonocardia sp. Ae331_Ps2]OLM05413.1 Benzoate 1,2-dioxygenase beta subunit [Pseudonocardia sp. Ae406_Ps2]OLM15639.1 Benzoate 1,2-dioxygenase beta subunit [Pseudonocardia sp. Ae505_Ps2]OLM26983.1 Benzoate 1,2-dioxygenase beta subunit [Pseudonocardia sp. Ae706_Ps2]OLM32901.1 Benzoate 1,2-dioxygenase beta subunit [Pseudonocardia sp. Ae717_Ps2]
MTTTEPATGLDLRTVEQFLYREARYADEHRYEDWEALWTPDALYWVPANDDDADRMTQMSIIHDNRNRIATRIRQYRTGRRHSQVPASRLRRVVSNVEILGTVPGTGDTEVGANFVLVESRERGTQLWAGRYTYRLRVVDGELAMSYKKVALVDNARAIATLAFLV